MRALVVGYGSIGERHARLLTELGCATAVLSGHQPDFPVTFDRMDEALEAHRPDYVVIASATHQHYEALSRLAEYGFAGVVLVEKPLFDRPWAIPPSRFSHLLVAYNLRWHPVLQHLSAAISGEVVLSVQAYVGQYLPDWRPQTDYRQSYSASSVRGGGVLRDLSHELDYIDLMFGPWVSVAAIGGHLSSLEIDTDDLYAIMLRTERCPVISLQMNYLDRNARRCLIVNTAEHTFEADLIGGTVACDGRVQRVSVERDHSYREMHRAALNRDFSNFCSAHNGGRILELIAAIERASERREWIST